MIRQEFEELRDLPNKIIDSDVEFIAQPNGIVFKAECIVHNSLDYELKLHGTYNDNIGSLVFNFSEKNAGGAICRYCINGVSHKDAISNMLTKKHKHSLQTDRCPSLNLPYARERKDLEISSAQDIQGIWERVCDEASIKHFGEIVIR